MIETDHDMRNSADFISLDRVARSLIRLPGVAMVQSITRPMGRALERAKIPYLFTTQGSGNGQQLPFNRQQNANTDQQAQIQTHSVAVLRKEIDFFQQMSDEIHKTALTVEDLQRVTNEMNSEISNLDDFFRPIKSYFYFDHHCFDVPLCWAFRSVFDTLDNIDKLAADINDARASLDALDKIVPQIIVQLKLTADDTEALCRSFGQAPTVPRICSPPRRIRPLTTWSMWGSISTRPRAMTSSTSPEKVSTTTTSRLAWS